MMINKKSVNRKWVAAAVAAYLLVMGDLLLPSLAIASLLPAQHAPDGPGGSEGGRTGSPRKALGGGFKLKGTVNLKSQVDFGKNKKPRAVESRSLRVTFTLSTPPSPNRNGQISQDPQHERDPFQYLGPRDLYPVPGDHYPHHDLDP